MGEWIEESPNHLKFKSTEIAQRISEIIGYPAESLQRIVILAEVADAEHPEGAWAFGSNMNDVGIGYALVEATHLLIESMAYQRTANALTEAAERLANGEDAA